MEYAQKRTSPLLAQILAQMQQQQQQFQPQSYGALAAGLGAQAINQNSLNKLMGMEAQQQQQNKTLLADMLTGRPAPKYENPKEGPLVELASQDDTIARILEGGGPELLQTGLMLKQAMTPKPREAQSPAGKLRADLDAGAITQEDFQRETTQTSNLPNEVKIAQFMYPGDEAKQREFLQTKSSSDLPAQIQVALWASDGDQAKARELVRKKLEGKDADLSLSGLMAGVVQKMVEGKQLTAGEKAAMDWYKQNPLAALFAILGAQAGTKVED